MKFMKINTVTIAVLSALMMSAAQGVSAKERKPVDKPYFGAPPRIQLAILLDTSNSMDGLIDQTRNQLWQVVNEFSSATQNGIKPQLEVALFEYGNDSNSERNGYIRQLSNFTGELDKISEGLFALKTNGGDEFCGYAIKEAVDSLRWSDSNRDIKTIFIAGNEPFTQGPVNYRSAIELAGQQDIAVNTIYAGGHQEGADTGWQKAARLGDGNYMSIDADQKVVHIDAPQDRRISLLNDKLNDTYIAYGAKGASSKSRQMEQDDANNAVSAGLMAKRAKTKASSFYSNSEWDLVDAIKDGNVTAEELEAMPVEALPVPMKPMSATERTEYVAEKSAERQAIKAEIQSLSKEREVFVAEKRREEVAAGPSVADAITDAIHEQAEEKGFVFSEK